MFDQILAKTNATIDASLILVAVAGISRLHSEN